MKCGQCKEVLSEGDIVDIMLDDKYECSAKLIKPLDSWYEETPFYSECPCKRFLIKEKWLVKPITKSVFDNNTPIPRWVTKKFKGIINFEEDMIVTTDIHGISKKVVKEMTKGLDCKEIHLDNLSIKKIGYGMYKVILDIEIDEEEVILESVISDSSLYDAYTSQIRYDEWDEDIENPALTLLEKVYDEEQIISLRNM